MTEQIANFAQSATVGSINSTDLTVVLVSASTFPTSGIFRIRIDNELLQVASVSGDTLTISPGGRGIEGTVAATHADSSDVFGPLTKTGLENIIDQRAPTSVTMGGQVTGSSASATVAASHSGSTHAATQAAAEATAASALSTHQADTTSIHGITDTAVLATATSVATAVSAHTSDAVDAHDASSISFVPAGTISSTDVQSALEEVAAEGGGGGGGSGLQYAVVVASNDMPAAVKSSADFICDGVADQNEINLAIDRASAIAGRTSPGGAVTAVSGATQRGMVQLTGGRFNISAPILLRTGVTLAGAGTLTDLKAAATMTNAGAGTRIGVIKKRDVNVNNVRVTGVMINGSGSNVQDGIGFTSDGGVYDQYPSNHVGDANDYLDHYNIYNIPGTGTGINLNSTNSLGRGFFIGTGRIHNTGNIGISISGTPDGHIADVQIGGANTDGFAIGAGNIKISNCKAFYCDSFGFNLASGGRGSMSSCEVQDSLNGYNFPSSATQWSASALTADTCSTDCFVVGSSGIVLSGIQAFLRGSGRYGATTNGIRIVGSPTDMMIIGAVGASIGTEFNGTPGARSFVRVSTGSTLVSFG